VPVFAELQNAVIHTGLRLNNALRKIIEYRRQTLQGLADRPVFKQPVRLLDGKRQYLDSLQGKLALNLSLTYERKSAILKEKAARINSLSPVGVLARGYVLCYDEKGALIKSVKQTKLHSRLTVKTNDGRIVCSVQDIWGEASES
jgi:exodeoxyribonuclease VII large subunit